MAASFSDRSYTPFLKETHSGNTARLNRPAEMQRRPQHPKSADFRRQAPYQHRQNHGKGKAKEGCCQSDGSLCKGDHAFPEAGKRAIVQSGIFYTEKTPCLRIPPDIRYWPQRKSRPEKSRVWLSETQDCSSKPQSGRSQKYLHYLMGDGLRPVGILRFRQ